MANWYTFCMKLNPSLLVRNLLTTYHLHVASRAGPRELELQRHGRVQRVKIDYEKLRELCLHAAHVDDDVSKEERFFYSLHLTFEHLIIWTLLLSQECPD